MMWVQYSGVVSLKSGKVIFGGDTWRLAPLGLCGSLCLEEKPTLYLPKSDVNRILTFYKIIEYESPTIDMAQVWAEYLEWETHTLQKGVFRFWCLLPLGAPKQQAHFKGAPRGIQQDPNFSVASAIAHHDYCFGHIWLGFSKVLLRTFRNGVLCWSSLWLGSPYGNSNVT